MNPEYANHFADIALTIGVADVVDPARSKIQCPPFEFHQSCSTSVFTYHQYS